MGRGRMGERVMGQPRGPIVLVISPHAGSASGRDPEGALRAAGVVVGERLEVSALDSLPPQGDRWKAAGFAGAVAAGGDGTVGAVASHLAGTDLSLGILPLGTANDVARSLDLPLELDAAAEVIAAGATRTIDLGCARPASTEPAALDELDAAQEAGITTPRTERIASTAGMGAYFVHALTLGINVEFARLATNATRRQRLGPLTYIASALECITSFQPVPVRVRLEGVLPGAYRPQPLPEGTTTGESVSIARTRAVHTIEGTVVQVAAVVTPVFGGAYNLRLPDVDLSDRLLDFIVIEALEPSHLSRMIERVGELLGRVSKAHDEPQAANELMRQDIPGLWRFKAQAAHIATPEAHDVTLDGEIRGRTPLDVWTAPDALRVCVPAQEGAAAPSQGAGGEVSGV
jgi:diacylglycerol kinase (ATP)